MHREKHLLPRVIDLANLQRGFIVSARAKRHQPEVQAFAHDLETHLWEMRREVEAGAYRWGPYRRFLIHDPKRREIRAAPFRDRVLHHAIFNVLDPIVRRGFIADTYACWLGLAAHADAFRLSRAIFRERDAGNLGKRLAVQALGRAAFAPSAPRADLSCAASR